MTTKAENVHKVPGTQWQRWSEQARIVFNELYETMHANQSLFLHPQSVPMSDEQWTTTCWNAAWTAADAVMNVRTVLLRKAA